MKNLLILILFVIFIVPPVQAGQLFPPENGNLPPSAACPTGQALTWTGTSVACTANTIPAGAVMMFNLAACPAGWSPLPGLAGRTVIGAGAGAGLTLRSLGETGGEENHTLSVTEIPAHAHGTDWQEYNENGKGSVPVMASGNSNSPEWYHFSSPTLNAGGDQPHNNMPPYIALLYCQKN
ncbi:MAG: hypothetical protein PHD48_02720 [Alphaproteobacteria bacterium]|nr:hypothetical protein [Alphaproteobacteria bacterium]